MRAAVIALALAGPASAAPCGGDFGTFLAAMEAEAVAAGVLTDRAAEFFATVQSDERVLRADRAPGVDGILGAGTRAPLQMKQTRFGLPADGWPTRALLDAL